MIKKSLSLNVMEVCCNDNKEGSVAVNTSRLHVVSLRSRNGGRRVARKERKRRKRAHMFLFLLSPSKRSKTAYTKKKRRSVSSFFVSI